MVEQFFNNIIPTLEQFQTLAYWIAFFAAFLETALLVGLFIPGSTVLLLLGVYAAGGHLDFGALLFFAIIGAVLGDNLNYWLGRRYGHKWVGNGIGFLTPEHFKKPQQFFLAHGGKSVFLGRFIPSVKELVPFIAGTMEMPQRKFMFWNILGAIGWGIQWLGAGFLFAHSLKLAHIWISRVGVALLLVLLISILFWFLKRWLIRYGHPVIALILSLARSIKTAIVNNPDVIKLLSKHPRFFAFIGKRLDRSHFFGLPASLLGFAFFYVLMLFAGIVEDLLTTDPVVAVDHHVSQLLNVLRTPDVNQFFYWVTELGTLEIILPLLGVATIIFWLLRKALLSLPLLVSSLGAFSFTQLGKLAFQRARPDEALLLEQTYSFPSGHATIAVALYGYITYLLIRHSSEWKRQVNLFFLGGLVILLIGLSRIMLGVHYLSDVWAGYLVGSLWLIIGISITEWLVANGKVSFENTSPKRSRKLAWILASSFLLYCASASVIFPANWLLQRKTITVQLQGDIAQQLIAQKAQYTQTFLGEPMQPLSVAIVGDNENDLLARLQRAGWQNSDKPRFGSLKRLALEGMAYTTAPVAPGFWSNKVNDYALAKSWQLQGKPAIVSLRLWETPYRLGDKTITVGTVRAFDRIEWRLLRHVYPDIDSSREVLLESLQQSKELAASCKLSLTPAETNSYLLGNRLFTQGELLLLDLGSAYQAKDARICSGRLSEDSKRNIQYSIK